MRDDYKYFTQKLSFRFTNIEKKKNNNNKKKMQSWGLWKKVVCSPASRRRMQNLFKTALV